jgi:hypothetical protein
MKNNFYQIKLVSNAYPSWFASCVYYSIFGKAAIVFFYSGFLHIINLFINQKHVL